MTRSFGVFFDLCLNKRLSKQSRPVDFQTPSCSLWRHCNEPRLTYKDCLSGTESLVIEIRLSYDRLIFIIWISLLIKRHFFYIETASGHTSRAAIFQPEGDVFAYRNRFFLSYIKSLNLKWNDFILNRKHSKSKDLCKEPSSRTQRSVKQSSQGRSLPSPNTPPPPRKYSWMLIYLPIPTVQWNISCVLRVLMTLQNSTVRVWVLLITDRQTDRIQIWGQFQCKNVVLPE